MLIWGMHPVSISATYLSSARQRLRRLWHPQRWAWAVVWAAPSLLLGFLLWRQEAIDPLTAPSLIVDRGLQIVVLVMVLALPGLLFAPGAVAFYSALALCMAGWLLSTTVGLAGLLRPGADARMLSLSVVAFLGTSSLLLLVCAQVTWLRSGRVRLAGALLALLLPFLQFWHGASFLPGRTEANLTQTADARAVGGESGQLRSLVSVTAQNNTDARVLIIITNMTVCWWRSEAELLVGSETIPPRDRENCRVLRPLGERSWISAKSSLTYQVALETRADHPLLQVSSQVAYARGDRLRISGKPLVLPAIGKCKNASAVRLDEESRFKGLAQQDKYLVYADRNGDGGRNYFFLVGSKPTCSADADTRLQNYFGVTEARLIHETWLVVPASTAGSR